MCSKTLTTANLQKEKRNRVHQNLSLGLKRLHPSQNNPNLPTTINKNRRQELRITKFRTGKESDESGKTDIEVDIGDDLDPEADLEHKRGGVSNGTGST